MEDEDDTPRSDDDLNKLVDFILTSKRRPTTRRERRRRFKMDETQTGILENEFQKNPNWTNAKYAELCELLQTTKSRIYKWNWDRKKKF